MPKPRRPEAGGESSGCARDARADDWLDLGASTGEGPPVKSRIERKEQLNVWLASDQRVQARKNADPRVSPLLLVVLGPDFESTSPGRQKPETLPATKSTRSRIADENPRVSSSKNQRRRSGKTLRRVGKTRKENGVDRSPPAR